jgi:hypothetical protein
MLTIRETPNTDKVIAIVLIATVSFFLLFVYPAPYDLLHMKQAYDKMFTNKVSVITPNFKLALENPACYLGLDPCGRIEGSPPIFGGGK